MSLSKALEINKQGKITHRADKNLQSYPCKFLFDEKDRGYIAYSYKEYFICLNELEIGKKLLVHDYNKWKQDNNIHIPRRLNKNVKLFDYIYIDFAYTLDECQYQGVFKNLLFKLVNLAIKEQKIILLHSYRKHVKLYHKLGFKMFNINHNFTPPYLLSFDYTDYIMSNGTSIIKKIILTGEERNNSAVSFHAEDYDDFIGPRQRKVTFEDLLN